MIYTDINSLEGEYGLIMSDPPWMLRRGGKKAARPHSSGMPLDYPTQSLEEIKDYLQIATEHTTEDAVLFLWTTEKYLRQAEDIATELGYKLHNRMIYSKYRYYMQVYECILMLKKGRSRTINNPSEKNILKCGQVRNRVHPTEKPIEILETLIKNSSNESDVVIDPFMGSGTTGIACHNLKRRFIGIEIDKQYYDIAVQRLFENR